MCTTSCSLSVPKQKRDNKNQVRLCLFEIPSLALSNPQPQGNCWTTVRTTHPPSPVNGGGFPLAYQAHIFYSAHITEGNEIVLRERESESADL